MNEIDWNAKRAARGLPRYHPEDALPSLIHLDLTPPPAVPPNAARRVAAGWRPKRLGTPILTALPPLPTMPEAEFRRCWTQALDLGDCFTFDGCVCEASAPPAAERRRERVVIAGGLRPLPNGESTSVIVQWTRWTDTDTRGIDHERKGFQLSLCVPNDAGGEALHVLGLTVRDFASARTVHGAIVTFLLLPSATMPVSRILEHTRSLDQQLRAQE